MNDEQLKRGQELKSEIDKLKESIEYWEKARGVTEIRLHFFNAYPSETRFFTDEGDYINFKVLKTLTLQSMCEKLETLEKEYREL